MEDSKEQIEESRAEGKIVAGMAASFENPKELLGAASAFRKAGYQNFDTHSPFPIHGMDKAMDIHDSRLGWIVITCAILGGLGGYALQVWAAAAAYPLLISGKPYISTEAFVPITFELIILSSAFSVVIGMFMLNGLPKFSHSLFTHTSFYRASYDRFFLSVAAEDPQFDAIKTKSLMKAMGGEAIEILYDQP